MSQENVDIVRHAFAAVNRGDRATAIRYLHPEIVIRNDVRFSGRVLIGTRAHSLRPGRYRASLRATDPSGNRSKTKRIYFAVVRR